MGAVKQNNHMSDKRKFSIIWRTEIELLDQVASLEASAALRLSGRFLAEGGEIDLAGLSENNVDVAVEASI